MDKFRSWTLRVVRRFRFLLRARMNSILLGDADELPFHVVSSSAEAAADLFQFGHVRLVEGKSVRGERFLWIVHQLAPELRVFHGPPNHRANHLVAHGASCTDESKRQA